MSDLLTLSVLGLTVLFVGFTLVTDWWSARRAERTGGYDAVKWGTRPLPATPAGYAARAWATWGGVRQWLLVRRMRRVWPVLSNALDALARAMPGTPAWRVAEGRVLRAWCVPGVRPDVHRDSQDALRLAFPELAANLDVLAAGIDGGEA